MLLAHSATLRMNELRVIALQIVVIVGNGLMIGRLLIIIRNEVDDVAMNIVATVGVLRRIIVDSWCDHVTIQ